MNRNSQILILFSSFLFFIIPGCHQTNEYKSSDIGIIWNSRASTQGPENTFASATNAIQCGADYVEIDIRRSKDGVYYIICDSTLDRTTNGTGPVAEVTSEYIDALDAGSWYGYEYVGEHVPRLQEFLKWIKGKARVSINIKEGDKDEVLKILDSLDMKDDYILSYTVINLEDKVVDPDEYQVLKIDGSLISRVESLLQKFKPRIIECNINSMTEEFIAKCHEKGIKVTASIPGNDWPGYRKALSLNIDLVNINSPCVFSNMRENNGLFKGYRLIAHRGGITGGEYNEFDPASIQKAIERGYYMLELDVRKTSDGVLIVHHDSDFRRFFNDPRRVDEVTWEEVQTFKSDKGNYHPLSFEEVAQMCSGKVKLMIEIKVRDNTPAFYKQLGDIMEKYDLLGGAYFLGNDIEPFMDKAKMSINMGQVSQLMAMLKEGKDVARHYFLFDAGTRMTSSVIKWAQQNSITVVVAINVHNYVYENDMEGAQRDIEFFKECGVTEFQIDSQYDKWLPVK